MNCSAMDSSLNTSLSTLDLPPQRPRRGDRCFSRRRNNHKEEMTDSCIVLKGNNDDNNVSLDASVALDGSLNSVSENNVDGESSFTRRETIYLPSPSRPNRRPRRRTAPQTWFPSNENRQSVMENPRRRTTPARRGSRDAQLELQALRKAYEESSSSRLDGDQMPQ